MRSFRFVVFAAILAIMPITIKAQACSIGVDYMKMSTMGNDTHIGDVFTYHDDVKNKTVGKVVVAIRDDYGVSNTPIVVSPRLNPTYLFGGDCHRGRFGISVRGWSSSSFGSVAGRVQSPDLAQSDNSTMFVGLRFFDQDLQPVGNDNEKSGLSPIDYHADDRMGVGKADLLLEANLVDSKNLRVSLLVGGTVSRVTNSRSEGLSQNAHYKQEYDSATFGTHFYDRESLDFSNRISIESSSSSHMTLVGPSVGIDGTHQLRRLEFNWRTTGSLLLGKVRSGGVLTDIDDETIVHGLGIPFKFDTSTTFLQGVLPSSKEDDVVIPMLELYASAGYRVTNHVSVGGGVFVSSWFNVPTAPSWSVPGYWTALAGSFWKDNKRSPTFAGLSAFVRFSF